MFKNREFRIFVGLQSFVVLLLLFFLYLNVISAFVAFIIASICLVGSNVCFQTYRYNQIKQLTSYLTRLQEMGRTLELRDQREGELSILKNELYKISVTLNTQAELLRRDKTYLADSISDISHQLKTPLTSMMMMVDLLEQDNLPEEKRKTFIRNISIGLERMEWLVQSLLKLSKLDADAVQLKKESVEVTSLIQEAVEPLLISLEIRKINFCMEQLSEPIYFQGDFGWTQEAVTNIIKNCMEHTSAGGTIKVTYSDNNLYTMISIRDTGSGIAKEDLPHIFERFYKGKNSKSDSVGIGLALSKEIITRQKGRIEVTSRLGEGSTFFIRFYR